MVGWALVLVAAALAGAESGELVRAVETFNAHADQPLPVPAGEDLEDLAAGELVRIRETPDEPDEPQRVVGLQVIDHSRAEMWVATGDDHYSDIEEFTWAELDELPPPRPGHRWLHYLDVAWPFHDRYWVIDSWYNLDMVQATGGRMWENPWRLVEGGPELAAKAVAAGELEGITPADLDKAVYTPVNRGAWVAIELEGDRHLFGYHVTTVVGGAIPDDLIAWYSMHTLRRMFKGGIGRIPELQGHYDADHEPVIGGDNEPIPPFTGG